MYSMHQKKQSLSVHLTNEEHIYLELQPQPKLFFYPVLDRDEKDWNLVEVSMLSLFVRFTLNSDFFNTISWSSF